MAGRARDTGTTGFSPDCCCRKPARCREIELRRKPDQRGMFMALGGPGHWPVPSGDSPDGTERRVFLTPARLRNPTRLAIPVGGSPTGTGGSPVPPILKTRHTSPLPPPLPASNHPVERGFLFAFGFGAARRRQNSQASRLRHPNRSLHPGQGPIEMAQLLADFASLVAMRRRFGAHAELGILLIHDQRGLAAVFVGNRCFHINNDRLNRSFSWLTSSRPVGPWVACLVAATGSI